MNLYSASLVLKQLRLELTWLFLVAFIVLSSGCKPGARVSPSADPSPPPSSPPSPGPITLNMLDPSIYQSSDPTPTFLVTGLNPGESVTLFGDQNCSENQALTALSSVRGSTAQITSPTLTPQGIHTFSARSKNTQNLSSPCVALAQPYILDTVNPVTCTSQLVDDYAPNTTEAWGTSITQDSQGALFTTGYERATPSTSFSLLIRRAPSPSPLPSFTTSLSSESLDLSGTGLTLTAPTITQGLTIAGNTHSSSNHSSLVIAGGRITTGGTDYPLALKYTSNTWSLFNNSSFPTPSPAPSPTVTPILNTLLSSALSSDENYPTFGGALKNRPFLGYSTTPFTLIDPNDFGGSSFALSEPLSLIAVRQPTTHSVSVISVGKRILSSSLNAVWYTRISFANPQPGETPQDLDNLNTDSIYSPNANHFQSEAHGITTPLQTEGSLPDVTPNIFYIAGQATIPSGQGTTSYPEGQHWLVRKVNATDLTSPLTTTLDDYQYTSGQNSSANDITHRTNDSQEPDLFVTGSLSTSTGKHWSLRSLRSGANRWYNAEIFQYAEGFDSEPKKIVGSGNTFYVVGSGSDSTNKSHLLVKKYTCN